MAEIIRLGQRLPKTQSFLGKIKFPFISPKISPVAKVLASPVTTVGLAGTLGALLAGPVGALKAATLTALGLGILKTSPTAVEFVKKKITKPLAPGEFVGRKIEEIAAGKPLEALEKEKKSLKEQVITGLKAAGLVGGGAALAAAVAAAVKKVRAGKVPDIPEIISQLPSGILEVPALQQLPQQVPPQIQPLGPAEKPAEEIKAVPIAPTMPTINNRIKVAPEINISFRKSRRFINQQINL